MLDSGCANLKSSDAVVNRNAILPVRAVLTACRTGNHRLSVGAFVGYVDQMVDGGELCPEIQLALHRVDGG